MKALLVICVAGCSAVSGDPGLDAKLEIASTDSSEPAQFNPGKLPADGSGPRVLALDVAAFSVTPGTADLPLIGMLDPSATAIGLYLDGDRGWWLLTAGVPDFNSPTMPTFSGTMSFARSLQPGTVTLIGRAIDAHGIFGPASSVMLQVNDQPAPSGRLTVSLSWGSPTDLDLHVVDPGGTEIWGDSPTSASGGSLDLDSNNQCVIDGRDRENVTWAQPPLGHYDVRVDTFSLCGQPGAAWRVEVMLDGAPLGSASGMSVDSDTLGKHQRGSGREVLGFDVP